jgi:hypothetical protein
MKREAVLLKLVELLMDSPSEPVDSPEVSREERAVVVFTDTRGVFFGYTGDTAVGTVKLRRARNCHYWAKQKEGRQHGFLGLAKHGPAEGSRISVEADIELTGVTCIAECTADAIEAWESSTWK